MTTMVSPNVGLQSLIPSNPIEPITVNVASSSLTLSGIFATRFPGTQTYSAWLPLDATRSPTRSPLIPFPMASTIPTLQ